MHAANAVAVGLLGGLAACANGPPSDRFTLGAAGATFDVAWDAAAHRADERAMRAWITDAADAVHAWYGTFPVSRVELTLYPVDGDGAEVGMSLACLGPKLMIMLGRSAGPFELTQDQVLTHEMAHLAFDLRSEHSWMSEGQASYVQLLAGSTRQQAVPTAAWAELERWLRAGLPAPDDGGLDDATIRRAQRLYCGGVLFWFVADVETRRRTENRRGVRDALRAILAAGGGQSEKEPFTLATGPEVELRDPSARSPEWMCARGDEATGTTVLTEMYQLWRATAVKSDLDGLLRDLGVVPDGAGGVRLDDAAPLASIRRSIVG